MPKGTRHRATQLAEKLMEDDAENIVRAVVSAAKAGDPTAMRLCVERLVPLRKGRPVVFDLPPVKTAADIAIDLCGKSNNGTKASRLRFYFNRGPLHVSQWRTGVIQAA
jgi:hypothetical protein